MKQVMRMFVLIVIGAFCLWIVPVTQVHAVGDQTVTGLPPNTAVTITLPDGTPVEEETDDDGNLVYPFPKGDSKIAWDGGSKVVSTAGGASAGVIAGGITAGVIGAGVIIGATDSDSNNNNSGNVPSGSVLALRIDNSNTASDLSPLALGNTIPLACMTGEILQGPDVCTVSDCSIPQGTSNNHVHGTIVITASPGGSSVDSDMGGCGHGCIVSTSSPTVTCTP
jgi:hypothetical protein